MEMRVRRRVMPARTIVGVTVVWWGISKFLFALSFGCSGLGADHDRCVAGSTSCRAVDGSSKSGNDDGNDDSTGGSVGVDVSKKKGTKGGKSGTGSLLDLLDGDDNDNDNKEQEPARGAGSRMAVGGRVLEVVVVGVAILVL